MLTTYVAFGRAPGVCIARYGQARCRLSQPYEIPEKVNNWLSHLVNLLCVYFVRLLHHSGNFQIRDKSWYSAVGFIRQLKRHAQLLH